MDDDIGKYEVEMNRSTSPMERQSTTDDEEKPIEIVNAVGRIDSKNLHDRRPKLSVTGRWRVGKLQSLSNILDEPLNESSLCNGTEERGMNAGVHIQTEELSRSMLPPNMSRKRKRTVKLSITRSLSEVQRPKNCAQRLQSENLTNSTEEKGKDFSIEMLMDQENCLDDETRIRSENFDDEEKKYLLVKKRRISLVDENPEAMNRKHFVHRHSSNRWINTFTKAQSFIEQSLKRKEEKWQPDEPSEIVYSLHTVFNPRKKSMVFKSIDPMVLLECLQSPEFSDKYILIDCRFPYEYEGGHISMAVNIFDDETLIDFLLPAEEKNFADICKKIPIFYCEHSSKRGPMKASKLRSEDRIRHSLEYPAIDYPEIYLLDRGYVNFYSIGGCKEYCEPSVHVPMDDPRFKKELEMYENRYGSSLQRVLIG